MRTKGKNQHAAPAPRDEHKLAARGAQPTDHVAAEANGAPAATQRTAAPPTPAATADTRPVLALFCYEELDSPVGRHVTQLAAVRGRAGKPTHLFARRAAGPQQPEVTVHAVGEPAEGDLLARVQDFTDRACNAFLDWYSETTAPVTLMGCEWSAVPALSLLHGVKDDLNSILSLHSLERQRSAVDSDLSQRIEGIEQSGLREVRAILAHGAAVADAARQLAPGCADRVRHVPEVFPAAAFALDLDPGQIKARYEVGPLDPVILCIGDLNERYGPDLLVKAMPAVLRNHKQARLVFVGDGAQLWPLRVYARYLLLEHAVRFVGDVREQALAELVRAADLIAVPSRRSTPWWPIQAAWAAGRPVVASHEAAPGLLAHEQDAVLVYPNPGSCVWGIERVLYDGGLRDHLAARGRQKLEDRFGWGAAAAQVEELMSAAPSR
ncbi:MAG: glycosyltransferase family 4 protein [Gemmataceae bacterium]|nr:glycosyltransferase family 4 protein [Gemmataceae bacterium]